MEEKRNAKGEEEGEQARKERRKDRGLRGKNHAKKNEKYSR